MKRTIKADTCEKFKNVRGFVEAVPSVLWCCWLGSRKGIRPVKTEWRGTSVVVCLKRGANDLHMVQLMPLPPRHLLLKYNPEWFTFLVPAYQVVLEKRPLNGRSSSCGTTSATHAHITVLWPLLCVSWHTQLITGGFCWREVLLPACPFWQQLAHLEQKEDAWVLLDGVSWRTLINRSINWCLFYATATNRYQTYM